MVKLCYNIYLLLIRSVFVLMRFSSLVQLLKIPWTDLNDVKWEVCFKMSSILSSDKHNYIHGLSMNVILLWLLMSVSVCLSVCVCLSVSLYVCVLVVSWRRRLTAVVKWSPQIRQLCLSVCWSLCLSVCLCMCGQPHPLWELSPSHPILL